MMKIAMPILRFKPAIGGGEECVYQVAKRLVQRGHEVYVLTSDLLKTTPNYVYFRRKANQVDGMTVQSFHALRLLRDYPVVPKIFSKLIREKVDIIHGHGYGYFTSDFSALASRICSVPFILSTHGFFPLAIHANRFLITTYVNFSRIGLLKIAKKVIAASTFDALLYAQLLEPRKICVVPNGVDINKWRALPGKNLFRTKYGLDGPIVASVGRIAWVKGFQYVIRAASNILKDFPDTKIIIAGEDFGYLTKLIRLAQKLKIPKDSIIFTGGLSEREIKELYAAMDILVIPSIYEPFGIVALEAMACGKPVVASACGGLPDIIKHGINGLTVTPQDTIRLAKAVVSLLKDPHLTKTMGENNQIEVRKYSWDNIVKKIENIYYEET